jgi:hypothetical protein
MTEHDWLECDQSRPMLDYLIHKASSRKFRLYAVACCRRIWAHLRDDGAREAVAVAERFAEGNADKQELNAARVAVTHARRELHWRQHSKASGFALEAVSATVADQPWDAARQASWASAWASLPAGPNQPEERRAHAELVREVFGNPFARPLGGVEEAPWSTGEVFHEAERIYDYQAFSDLPRLAETLDRAGCDDAGLLAHLRKSGSHCRGCWALDRLTGRV